MDPFVVREVPLGHLLHRRGQVYGIDQFHLRKILHQAAQGTHDVFHGLAIVLPPVAGDQNDPLPRIIQRVKQICPEAIGRLHRGFEGVDHRIPGDKDAVPNALLKKVLPVGWGGAEMKGRQVPHQGAVHLLRKGGVAIPGAQAGLHMAHCDLLIKGSQRAGKGGGGVSVDQHQVWLFPGKHLLQPQQAFAGDGVQALPVLHDVQVIVGRDGKQSQHIVQHLAVLGRDAADALDLSPAFQLLHQGGHLHCLRPGPEDRHDFQGHGCLPPLVALWVLCGCRCGC